MAGVPRVTPQAGKGGAELQQLGAQARYVQDAIGQAGAPVKAVAYAAATGTLTFVQADIKATDTVTIGGETLALVANGAVPGEGEVEIGADATETQANLLAALQALTLTPPITFAASGANKVTATAAGATAAVGNDVATAASVTTADALKWGAAKLAGGVDRVLGTAAPAGGIRTNGTKAWVAVKDCTVDDTTGWKEITTGSGL